jgi:hypothetical protein
LIVKSKQVSQSFYKDVSIRLNLDVQALDPDLQHDRIIESKFTTVCFQMKRDANQAFLVTRCNRLQFSETAVQVVEMFNAQNYEQSVSRLLA